MKIYAALPISGMPDLTQGLPSGTVVYLDTPDTWLEDNGKAMVLLELDTAFTDMEENENEDGWILTGSLHQRHIHILAVGSSSGEFTDINRSVLDIMYDELRLYHGTSNESAENISENGWTPGSGMKGANCGQNKYLYCTTGIDNALWFAEENGGRSVLSLKVKMKALIVDPEDGMSESVLEEMLCSIASGLPGNFAVTSEIRPSDISHVPDETLQDNRKREPGCGVSSQSNGGLIGLEI